ncbi:MAG: preprotein translocase subunit SecY [Anaerovoracaceae bacterium]|nr:preprotein translocase subunit SecY [Anaerovoracaceae bacterium]
MEMLQTIGKAWKIPELRRKIIFTLLMLVVFRIGSNIPVPGIDRSMLEQMFSGEYGLFDLFDLFSGGAFGNMTIFALSITPYITASIILQLLTIAIPSLERLAKEGLEGRKKITAYTRYLTVALAIIQAIGMTLGLFRKALISTSAFSVIIIVVTLTAGTAFLMWLGEQINEHGIGNGISLIIFGGIIARLPAAIHSTWTKYQNAEISLMTILLFLVFALVIILGIIEIQQGQRRIPVQYAKRVVGRKMYGGQSTHIPLKVNQAGVIPVIFAMSILQFPLTITYFMDQNSGFSLWVAKWLSPTGSPGVWVYAVFYALLTIFFTYFYTAVTFNPKEVADNMKQNGGFIPGIRPGRATVDYLSKVMNRISFVGAIFLAAVAVLPTLVGQFTALDVHFGGTSLLIAVGVALDTMRQLEQQMVMRNYSGFLK